MYGRKVESRARAEGSGMSDNRRVSSIMQCSGALASGPGEYPPSGKQFASLDNIKKTPTLLTAASASTNKTNSNKNEHLPEHQLISQ